MSQAESAREAVEAVSRADSRRVLATLIRLLGDLERAEEAWHDAFAAAVQQWPDEGVPANPRAWLVSTGRFNASDAIRRRARHEASLAACADDLRRTAQAPAPEGDDPHLPDDRLRLIFTCCPTQNCRRAAPGGATARVAPLRALHAAGGNCRGARRGTDRRRHRLAADRRSLRRAVARPGRRPRAHRRHPRARRTRRLPLGPCRPRRPVPAPGPSG